MKTLSYEQQALNMKYFNLLHLDQCIKRSNGNYNFRCPVCGDSKKSKIKKRGWYYPESGTFSCFNCAHPHNRFDIFLKEIFPAYYSEYVQENKRIYLSTLVDKKHNVEKPKKDLETITKDNLAIELPPSIPLFELSKIHPAKLWVDKRHIPIIHARHFRYCESDRPKDKDEVNYSNRIIIPFIRESDNLVYGFQARSLQTNNYVTKYLTLMSPDHLKIWNHYNVDYTKKVYCLEGPIDAMFIKNAVAAAGGTYPTEFLEQHRHDRLRFIFDNDKPGIALGLKVAKLGFKVFLWPKVKYKDINDCILDGYVPPVLDDNQYVSGKEAFVKLQI